MGWKASNSSKSWQQTTLNFVSEEPLIVRGNMEIGDWRNKIDGLDEQIVRLLSERAEAATAIGKLKQQSGSPIYEPQREQTVFEHVRKANPGPLSDVQIQHVYERIMDVMRQLQRPQ
jgi:chorismate mutase